MGRPTTSVEGFWDRPLHELFELLPATPAGLTTEEARRRLRLYGPNSFVHESRFAALLSFLGFFRNPLVVILVIASGVSLALGEHVGGLIILAIVLFSVLLNFLMEFQARHAIEDIQKQIALTAAVIRDRPLQELFELLPATPAGLTTEEASRRLRLYGPNSLVQESRFAALLSFFGFFA